jgi:hypothetical protein
VRRATGGGPNVTFCDLQSDADLIRRLLERTIRVRRRREPLSDEDRPYRNAHDQGHFLRLSAHLTHASLRLSHWYFSYNVDAIKTAFGIGSWILFSFMLHAVNFVSGPSDATVLGSLSAQLPGLECEPSLVALALIGCDQPATTDDDDGVQHAFIQTLLAWSTPRARQIAFCTVPADTLPAWFPFALALQTFEGRCL